MMASESSRKKSESESSYVSGEVDQLRKEVNSLMRHMRILGYDKQADVVLTINDLFVDRVNLKYSDPFYTHPCGHKMCLLAQVSQKPLGSPRGDGPTQAPPLVFAVHVCLMHGEFDGELKLPIKGHVTVQMLNQVKDADHMRRSKQVSWQYPCKKDPAPIPVIQDVPMATLYAGTNPDIKFFVNGSLRFCVKMNFIE